MEIELVKVVTALLLPPGGNLLGVLAGLALWRRAPALARALVVFALASLYALATPWLAGRLVAGVEQAAPITHPLELARRAEAIVVLAGGRNPAAPEYGGETVNDASLRRARYGALLQRATGLPLLVSGGTLRDGGSAEAELIAELLRNEFDVPVRWTETASRNTAENAIRSQALLAAAGIARIALVTDALHMPRAREMFQRVGLEVIPAPTAFHHRAERAWRATDWLPLAGALALSAAALHERLGRLWYRLRY